jgi:hypothetical protein
VLAILLIGEGCVGSTDCAITRHCSLASSSPSAVSD